MVAHIAAFAHCPHIYLVYVQKKLRRQRHKEEKESSGFLDGGISAQVIYEEQGAS